MKERILKTLVYRVTASGIAQILSWLVFRRVEINLIVLGMDMAQAGWYYVFEGVWNNLSRKRGMVERDDRG